MDVFDAIVVGGGPAGSSCAWKLSSAGFRVLVVDRARFPRDKLCAGWITPPVVAALQLDLHDYSRHRTVQCIRGFRTLSREKNEKQTDYGKTVSFGIIRREFDDFLLRRCGAEVCDGTPVKRIERRNGNMIINQRFSAPVLIGAGGHFCPVAGWLGVDRKKEAHICARELEVELEEEILKRVRVSGEFPLLRYCRDMRGYGWCFRKGRFVNVGLGRMEGRNLKAHLAGFLDWLFKRGILPREPVFDPLRFRGHAYKLHLIDPRPPVANGVLLAGDAAGLSHTFSGEGIRPAVESGILAAEVIRECGANYSLEKLDTYRRRLYRLLGTPWTGWRARLAGQTPAWLVEGLGKTVLSSAFLTRRVLLDRWFLRRHKAESEPRIEGKRNR